MRYLLRTNALSAYLIRVYFLNDVVDVVVPPKITEQLVKTCKELGITKVWMQIGSESEAAIKFCEENSIDVIHGVCVMVERRSRQE
jgi:predicted CoA-binding protein